ncbi:MAG: phosphatidylinositol-specific phospholipase C1-like protein [Bryobacterales bacterium]|nr:phosphatidylinositol-specific phospholipase C1-like protein [Bryobacterales bacterium]
METPTGYPQRVRWTFLLSTLALCCSAQTLRMNQIQIVGTHNSYHVGLAPGELAILRQQNPRAAESLAYKHPPLAAQLDAGVRQLELDVFGDTKGGLFADPLFLRLSAKAGTLEPLPSAWKETMSKPGFKVLHVSDVDFRSHCWTLIACLQQVRDWSKRNPRHLPLYIQLENKTGASRPNFVQPEPLTKATMDALDDEIRSVFPPGAVITPDDVRGTHATLEEAVLRTGWPELERARGKVVFLLDQERVTPLYTEGHPSLRGRMMFTNSKPGSPDAAFVKMNNPMAPEIPELVRKGYLIRTMTDGGTQAVRTGDTTRRDRAIASGAHILSTDYPFHWKAAGSGYSVELGGAKARCNPVNAPAPCTIQAPY